MKKKDIISLFSALDGVANLTGQKFGYSIARNFQLLKPEIGKIEESRKALIENYGKKVDGNLVVENNNYVFEDKKSFDEEYEKLLNEEVDIKIFTINIKDVPEQITAGQLTGIYPLIIDGK